jgi:hypothetical protein
MNIDLGWNVTNHLHKFHREHQKTKLEAHRCCMSESSARFDAKKLVS